MRRIASGGGIAAAFVALAIVQTFPLILHPGTHLPGEGLGDNVSFVWNVWWMREALSSASRSFFDSPMMFAPLGAPLILHTHSALAAWVGATMLAPLSVVEAENVWLIASLAFNGLSGYALARAAAASRWASFAAGALLLVSPVVTQRLMGHYNLVAIWPFVFACAAAVRWWRQPTWLASGMLGVAAGLVAYADYYLLVFFAVFLFTYVVVSMTKIAVSRQPVRSRAPAITAVLAALAFASAAAILMSDRSRLSIGAFTVSLRSPTNALTAGWVLAAVTYVLRVRPFVDVHGTGWWRLPRLGRPAAVAAVIAALLIAPLAGHAWTLWRAGGYVTQRSALRSGPGGVDAGTLVLGPPYGGIAGPFVRRAYRRLGLDTIESPAWVGLATMALMGIAWRHRQQIREARVWIALAVVFAIWSMGPYLTVFGANTGLLLPQALMRFVPIVNNARIPGRALIGFAVCAAVLSAMALDELRRQRRRSIGVALVVFGVAESIAVPLPLVKLAPPGVYERVRADRSPSTVVPVPFGLRDGFGERGRVEADAIYAQTQHGHPIAGGFIARLPPALRSWYEQAEPYATLLRLSSGAAVAQLPACEISAQGLRTANAGFVVLYTGDAPERARAFVEERLPVQRVAEDGQRMLFAVTGRCPPAVSRPPGTP